jgi:hypothetical protein
MNPASFLAMELIGSPLDGVLQVSDIGVLVLVVLSLMRVYQRIDKFEEAVARRLGARIAAGKVPNQTEIFPQPIAVKEYVEFTPLKDHQALKQEVGDMGHRIEHNFEELRIERSRSTGNLHERIERMSKEADDRSESLRKEMKADFRGVHERSNTLLEELSKLRGSIDACQRVHLHQ